MFKRVSLLSRLQLCNLFGLNEFRYTKDTGKRRRFLLLAVAWILVLIVSVSYVTGLSVGMYMLGLAHIIPVYLYTLVSLVVLIFSFFKAGSVLFSLKAYDMLMPLPVKKSAIIVSRFFTMYVKNLLLGLIVMVPGMVVYGICAHPTIEKYVITLVAFFFLPLLPLTLASIVGAMITALTSRMKHRGIGESVLTILVIVGIMVGSSTLSANEEMLTQEVLANLAQTLEEAIRNLYPLADWFAESLEGNIASFALQILVPAVLFVLFVGIVTANYQRICSALASTSAKNNYRMERLTQNSMVKALLKKELKRYFASGIYVSNTIIGNVLAVLFAGFVAVAGVDGLVGRLELPEATEIVKKLMPFALALMFSIMNMTACSVSMEGKNLWILQTLPINVRDVWKSKIYANLAVTAPFYVTAVILMCIGVRADWTGILWMILIPGLYICFMAVVGVKVNLWLPVFDWEQEVQVVKQSASVLVTMLVGMISVIVPLGLILLFPAYHVWVQLGTCLFLAIVTCLLYSNLPQRFDCNK